MFTTRASKSRRSILTLLKRVKLYPSRPYIYRHFWFVLISIRSTFADYKLYQRNIAYFPFQTHFYEPNQALSPSTDAIILTIPIDHHPKVPSPTTTNSTVSRSPANDCTLPKTRRQSPLIFPFSYWALKSSTLLLRHQATLQQTTSHPIETSASSIESPDWAWSNTAYGGIPADPAHSHLISRHPKLFLSLHNFQVKPLHSVPI